ncbi:YigZ family protein [Dolosicoccus paucivorans]|uniref:YigZ family protein n=1 Tax=Dolosicoccus paucivorans TaxID=84521 RepID=A0A1G8LHC9_9LACT|nr:YigZ family protein [Dolosicoccus paucivorans]PMB84799.1 YigZ family protein [Dolosicoccus paucivorans]PMC58559.1 YigZ family protein [Dolosicoccus paucivorans]SDI55063.1 uncharacterized protein, YigZ family [Dolosicoccus paucivorans]
MNYLSIQSPVQDEFIEKKSRFIGYLYPVRTVEEAQDIIQQLNKEHYKATHVCTAYILEDDSSIQKGNDDGEPSGTAGLPMLEVLKQNNLTYVLAAVVRYFGGVKLGAGGLIRAYSEGVSIALDKAQVIQNLDQAIIDLVIDYSQVDPFNYFMSQTDLPVTVMDTQYTDKVTFTLAIHLDQVDELKDQLTNLFNAQMEWKEVGEQSVDLPYTIKK